MEHEGGHKHEHHLGVDLHDVLPQQEDAAAQLARDADHILGVQFALVGARAGRDHGQVDAARLHRRQQIHLHARGASQGWGALQHVGARQLLLQLELIYN